MLWEITLCFTGIVLPVCLFFAGIYLLARLGRYVCRPAFVLCSVLKKPKSGQGGRSPASALCLALAGTLGVGNITGVAAAITAAGPGCVFWMWVCALVSAILKYAEIVLAVKHRVPDGRGGFSGGAYRYIRPALRSPVPAVLFCLLLLVTSITMGNMTQVRAASDGLFVSLGVPLRATGVIMLIAVLCLSLGGAEKISAFTLRLIPLLCAAYTVCCLIIIFLCRGRVAEVTSLIISEAFTPAAGLTGIAGVLLSPALRLGITRGIMSSEAGCGTAATAHAPADTDSPARQGLLGIFEVYCDTLLLCTLTAYVILLSGCVPSGEGTRFAIECFSSFLGAPAGAFLGISMFLFALGAVASWAFYGQEALAYLGGGRKTRVLYGLIFSVFAFMGSVLPEGRLWELSDLSVALMAVINVISVILLSREAVGESRRFYISERCVKSVDRTPKRDSATKM